MPFFPQKWYEKMVRDDWQKWYTYHLVYIPLHAKVIRLDLYQSGIYTTFPRESHTITMPIPISLLNGPGFGHFHPPPLEVIFFMIMHLPIDHNICVHGSSFGKINMALNTQ